MFAFSIFPVLQGAFFFLLLLAAAFFGSLIAGRRGLYYTIDYFGMDVRASVFFAALFLVVSPFYLLWVALLWVYHQFSPEARQKYAETVQQRLTQQQAKKDAQEADARRSKLYAEAKADPALAETANKTRVKEVFVQLRRARYTRDQKCLKGLVTPRIYDQANPPADTPLGRHVQEMRSAANLLQVNITNVSGSSNRSDGRMSVQVRVSKCHVPGSANGGETSAPGEFSESWEFVGSRTGWLLDEIEPQSFAANPASELPGEDVSPLSVF